MSSTPQLDVLIVDNNCARRDALLSALKHYGAYAHIGCVDHAEAMAIMQDQLGALFVIDAAPAASLQLADAARARGVACVFYAEQVSASDALEAMRAGVLDFAVNPQEDLQGFARAVTQARRRQSEQQQKVRDTSELQRYLRALELDQSAGGVVQRKLMPDTPAELADIGIAYRILPSLYLSGDAIDYGLFDDKYVAFYLLDVSGHSAASALVAVWVKQIVRGFFKGVGAHATKKPMSTHIPELMSHINKQLIEAEIGLHLTAFVGVIDRENSQLSYVVAGHLPLPLLVYADDVVELPGAGKPLGIFEDAQWSLLTQDLPEAFSMIVCSDGIFELLPQGDLAFRENYFKQWVSTHRPSSLAAFNALLDSPQLDAPPDDVSVLVLSKGLDPKG